MTWNDYKATVAPLLPKTIRFSAVSENGASRVLFRGHADSRWKLQTTLERAGHPEMPLLRYMRLCNSARRFASNHLPSGISFDEACGCGYHESSMHFPNYEYLGFMRHHGFPSPLLDWTESPYVAAFFAFRTAHPGAESVRIYAYRSHISHGRNWSAGDPCLFLQGPFAAIHERHAAQQCWYTVSMKSRGGDECIISSHEAAFEYARSNALSTQDIVESWDLPMSERECALADLFAMNITPFTLFRNPESLMETAAWRLL